MIFYVLANQISSIFLSMNLLTSLSFDGEIQNYIYGGSKEEIFLSVVSNGKTLVIKPKREGINTNLLVTTKKGKFYFNLSIDSENPHQFIEVREGEMNHSFKKIIEEKEYDILEGDTSLLFVNKTPKELLISGIRVKDKEYFSKGPPLMRDKKRIFN